MLLKWKYFTGFECPHTANSYLKSSFKEVWDKNEYFLDRTCLNKFRSMFDVNQWVINWYQMCKGNFSVKNQNKFGKYFALDDDNTDLINYMRDDKASVVCINDTDRAKNFDKAIKQVQKVFDEKLNEKCSFEK